LFFISILPITYSHTRYNILIFVTDKQIYQFCIIIDGGRMKKSLSIVIIFLFIGMSISTSSFNLEKQSTICKFNNPPYIPSNPYPIGEITDPNVTLSWDGGDPDPYDNVTYTIYFGTNTPIPIATIGPYPANKTRIHYYLGMVEPFRDYYWKIDARDNHNATSPSDIWSFVVAYNFPPDPPMIDGPAKVKIGVDYEFVFFTGDLEEHDVSYLIDWGDGTGEGWTDYYQSWEKIILNHTWYEKGSYTIRAKAKDIYGDESDFSERYITVIYDIFIITYICGKITNFEVLDGFIVRDVVITGDNISIKGWKKTNELPGFPVRFHECVEYIHAPKFIGFNYLSNRVFGIAFGDIEV